MHVQMPRKHDMPGHAAVGEPGARLNSSSPPLARTFLDPIPSVKAYRPSTTSKDLTELLDIADDESDLPRSEAANAVVRRRIVSGLFA